MSWLQDYTRVAILSDIHSNSAALDMVLSKVEEIGIDKLIILGDVLTYGCDPNKTLELLNYANHKWDTTFIIGNHDQFYFDIYRNESQNIVRLPGWIQESIMWTAENVHLESLLKVFSWKQDELLGHCYFAHANPFDFNDWSYLNSNKELKLACKNLVSRGAKIGVFGHNHKPVITTYKNGMMYPGAWGIYHEAELNKIDAMITNPGTIGQPRGRNKSPTFMTILESKKGEVSFNLNQVPYNIAKHTNSIMSSSLSSHTKEKLISYFTEISQ